MFSTVLASILFLAPAVMAENDGNESAAVDQAQSPVFVKTTEIAEPKSSVTRTFFGRIVAKETVDLSFEVPGYLNMIEAAEGTIIKAGTRVAALDQDTFERGVERAEIALQQAERNLERATKLVERRISATSSQQDAQTAYDLAQVRLKEARIALSDATMTAPFDALVAQRKAPLFTTVNVGQPIVQLHDMSEIRVQFDLPERVFNLIGTPETKTYMARVPGIGKQLPLKYVEYAAATGTIGQTYTVTLAFNGAQEAQRLVPGTSVTIVANADVPNLGTIIPASALFIEPNRSASVFVVEAQGDERLRVRKQAVGVSSSNGTTLSVSGVAAGTEIVEVGGQLLRDGQAVKRYVGLTMVED